MFISFVSKGLQVWWIQQVDKLTHPSLCWALSMF